PAEGLQDARHVIFTAIDRTLLLRRRWMVSTTTNRVQVPRSVGAPWRSGPGFASRASREPDLPLLEAPQVHHQQDHVQEEQRQALREGSEDDAERRGRHAEQEPVPVLVP